MPFGTLTNLHACKPAANTGILRAKSVRADRFSILRVKNMYRLHTVCEVAQ